MTSGMKVNQEALSYIESFTSAKGNSEKVIGVRLYCDVEKKAIVMDDSEDSKLYEGGCLKTYLEKMAKGDPGYFVIKVEYHNGGDYAYKIIFIMWASDTAKVKLRMNTASSQESVKKIMNFDAILQCNDEEEFTVVEIYKALKGKLGDNVVDVGGVPVKDLVGKRKK